MKLPADSRCETEETVLIFPLGEWILRTACRQMKEWQEQGLEHLSLTVNISAKQFQDANFFYRVKKILAETGLAASVLNLDITENMVMGDVNATTDILCSTKRVKYPRGVI